MSLLSNVLEAAYCNGTHHKLAFHALSHLQGPNAENWRNLFLYYHAPYLEGSKAPDKKFKDFQNHVLHVNQNNWGGAPAKAKEWYDKTVNLLGEGKWLTASYSAGVMSHYLTDPVMPFHTAQSKEETNIHRAVEWSISKSYDLLRSKIDQSHNENQQELAKTEGWLETAVIEAAKFSNQHYQSLIDRYDFKVGSKNPPAGLDDASREMVAQLLSYAQLLQARVMERAIAESGVVPPEVGLSLQGIIAALDMPIVWVTRKMADSKEQSQVKAMYREFKKTGQVEKHLTEDVRMVRDLVEKLEEEPAQPETTQSPVVQGEEVEAMPISEVATRPVIPASPVNEVSTSRDLSTRPTSTPREGLRFDADVVDAPSIGPKTAARLEKVSIFTVQDLLNAEPADTAKELNTRFITAKTIQDWQDQAVFAHDIPQLRTHDTQILVGGGIRNAAELAALQPEEVLAEVQPFVESPQASRIVKPGSEPDLREAMRWVGWAEAALQNQETAEVAVPLAS